MATGTTVLALYSAPINVWTEDELTRQTLTDLWADPQINVMSAGSEAGVSHLVNGAPVGQRGCVFGVVDRDFRPDNQGTWNSPGTRLFRLPAHEVENLLLDFDALSAVSGLRSAAEIRTEALLRATQLLWWMSCKGALRAIFEDGPRFPRDPPQPGGSNSVVDLATAVGHISASSTYWTDLMPYVGRWTAVEIQAEVQRVEVLLRNDLSSDDWLLSFSGKELLRHLRSTIPGLDTVRKPAQSAAERDVDLGKRVAAALQSSIPSPVAQLRQVLRQRVGLPP